MVIPAYITDTAEQIASRMRTNAGASYPGENTDPGSMLGIAVDMAAGELGRAADNMNGVYTQAFVSTAVDPALLQIGIDEGAPRKAATYAKIPVRFTGTPGQVVPLGALVTTFTTGTAPSQVFATDIEATVGGGGTTDLTATATTAGTGGNVPMGMVVALVNPLAGITAVTNPGAPTVLGIDEETQDAHRERILDRMANRPNGSNAAQYDSWAREVAGVGGARTIEVRDGPGTVSTAIIDSDKQPASQALVDAVQDYIAIPHRITSQPEAAPWTSPINNGITLLADRVRFAYSGVGIGRRAYVDVHAILPQAGIWQFRIECLVDAQPGAAGNIATFSVWNSSGAALAQTRPAGGVNSTLSRTPAQIGTALAYQIVEFYWDGFSHLDLRIDRNQVENGILLEVTQVLLRSTFSMDNPVEETKRTAGHRLWVESAVGVPMTISANVAVNTGAGYNVADRFQVIKDNLVAYVKDLALARENDPLFVNVGFTIRAVPGVTSYNTLLINGAAADLAITAQQVATLTAANIALTAI